jgi:hypothetical protein
MLAFHPATEEELAHSYQWYSRQADGLGDDFLSELELAYIAIEQMPETWPKFHGAFHRYLLQRFPFSVIYRQKTDTIYIIAIMHNSRKPNYWLDRIGEE